MIDIKRFFSRGLKIATILFLLLGLSVVVTPAPAYASNILIDAANLALDIAQDAYEYLKQKAITVLAWAKNKLVKYTTAALPFWFENVKISFDLGALGIIISNQLDSMIELENGKFKNDVRLKVAVAKNIARDAMKYATPNNDLLCKKIKLGQVYALTEAYMRDTSEKVQRSLAYVGRGAKDDYNGPLYAVDMEAWRCKWGFGDPKMGYKEIAGKLCVTHEGLTFGPTDRRLINADLTASTLDGMMPLERPPMKVNMIDGIKTLVLDVDEHNSNQLMWLAADNFCRQMQGPRKTPMHGKNIDTPKGLVERAIFQNTMSRQTQFNKACTDLLAYHTRPNKNEESDMVEAQNITCEMARGFLSDNELITKFDNCSKGLSQYQAEYIQHKMCKTIKNIVQKRAASRMERDLTDDMIDCSTNWSLWQLSVAERQGNLIDAVMGQQRANRLGGR